MLGFIEFFLSKSVHKWMNEWISAIMTLILEKFMIKVKYVLENMPVKMYHYIQ